MYNANKPSNKDLPSAGKLLKSTVIALVSAIVLLITVVLPSEYGIDPTRIGRLLGLTEMGEIKMSLEEEASADAQAVSEMLEAPDAAERPEERSPGENAGKYEQSAMGDVRIQDTAPEPEEEAENVTEASEPSEASVAEPAPASAPAAPEWSDEVRFVLTPGQGAEIKLVMDAGAVAEFSWIVEGGGGVANYDLHGDGGGRSINYRKGRGVAGDEGALEAAFGGNHGWFWRNRGKQDITVVLKVRGAYSKLKRVV